GLCPPGPRGAGPTGGRLGQPDPHRTPGRRPRRHRVQQPPDRRAPVHEPGNGEEPPRPRLRQARRREPGRTGRRGRPTPRPTGPLKEGTVPLRRFLVVLAVIGAFIPAVPAIGATVA